MCLDGDVVVVDDSNNVISAIAEFVYTKTSISVQSLEFGLESVAVECADAMHMPLSLCIVHYTIANGTMDNQI